MRLWVGTKWTFNCGPAVDWTFICGSLLRRKRATGERRGRGERAVQDRRPAECCPRRGGVCAPGSCRRRFRSSTVSTVRPRLRQHRVDRTRRAGDVGRHRRGNACRRSNPSERHAGGALHRPCRQKARKRCGLGRGSSCVASRFECDTSAFRRRSARKHAGHSTCHASRGGEAARAAVSPASGSVSRRRRDRGSG
jgi:hypothetical protein